MLNMLLTKGALAFQKSGHLFIIHHPVTSSICPTMINKLAVPIVINQCNMSSKVEDTEPADSKGLDSTDPYTIYGKVKYEHISQEEQRKSNKGREGFASSGDDQFSTLDDTDDSAETIGKKVKNGIAGIMNLVRKRDQESK